MPNPTSETTSAPTSTGNGEAQTSPTASAPATATPDAAPAPPQEFRYASGPGIPDYLVGKTDKEAAQITHQLYQQLLAGQTLNQQNQLNLSHQAPPNTLGMPDQSDFVNDPEDATKRYMKFVQQTQLTPEFALRDQMIGAQANAIAEMKYKDEFRRWGPEILATLNTIPSANRTPQVVDFIVDGIRGRHVNELVAENADARLRQLVETGQLRPQGAGGTGESASQQVDFDKLPPTYAAMLRGLGVRASQVDDILAKVYPQMPLQKAREKWMASAAKGDIITDGRGFKFEHGADNG